VVVARGAVAGGVIILDAGARLPGHGFEGLSRAGMDGGHRHSVPCL
jgi:hypothetical protein